MSLRYALLALLTAGPLTGYDAAKRFGASVGHLWQAPDSQIYPELRKMQKSGLIDGEEVRWGPNSTKTQYRITEEGLADFRQWMNTPHGFAPERDAHHLQAAYFEWAEPDEAREILRRHIEHHTSQVQLLTAVRDGIKAATDPAIIRRLAARPTHEHERIIAYKAHTYEGMIARSNSEIEWATRGLDLITELDGPPARQHPPAGLATELG